MGSGLFLSFGSLEVFAGGVGTPITFAMLACFSDAPMANSFPRTGNSSSVILKLCLLFELRECVHGILSRDGCGQLS